VKQCLAAVHHAPYILNLSMTDQGCEGFSAPEGANLLTASRDRWHFWPFLVIVLQESDRWQRDQRLSAWGFTQQCKAEAVSGLVFHQARVLLASTGDLPKYGCS